MNYAQRSEIVDRLERRHEDLIEQLDSLNHRIEQVLGSLTNGCDSLHGAEPHSGSQASLPTSDDPNVQIC